MNQPSETDEVRRYCLNHELNRPDVNMQRAVTLTICTLALCLIVSFILNYLADFNLWFTFDVCVLIVVLCFAKPIMVFLIRCYQRYAPESVRRQCSCMPSCSEYALLALGKYPWPKALWKIWRRVTHTCTSPGYHIDYP